MKSIQSLSVFCAFLVSLVALDAAPARPNVVLIISDDQGWSDFGFMGHPHIRTPHLDKLAAGSLTFQRGYSPVPLCRSSLASIATGLYPRQHGVTGNDPALPAKNGGGMNQRGNPEFARYFETIVNNFSKRPNLVRALTKSGYLTMQTGKWWEGDPIETAGFTHAMTRGKVPSGRHGDAGLDIGRKGLEPVFRFIEQAGEKPWFVWYAPMLPHSPHNPPDDLLQKYLKLAPTEPMARYWASVEWFDRTCGELLGYLDRKGLRENTIILFTTDNGYIQDPAKPNVFAARSKRTSYEGGVRTPIIVSYPAKIQPRMDREHLASNIDLWPTIAAMLGMPLPDGLPGINLTDDKAVGARQKIFGEQYAHDIANVDEPTRSMESRWVIDGWDKLIVPEGIRKADGKPELYDLRDDPLEKKNLAESQAARVAELSAMLEP
jgi:arylsulfatase A-like enzyme